jgi:hypothetical protein
MLYFALLFSMFSPFFFVFEECIACLNIRDARMVDQNECFRFIANHSNNVSTWKTFKPFALFDANVIVTEVVAVQGCLHNPGADRNPNYFAVHEVPFTHDERQQNVQNRKERAGGGGGGGVG